MFKTISVDFQKEFASPEGKWFNSGKSVNFIKDTIVPYYRRHDLKIFEIISDYRQPRPGDSGDGCSPGTLGYESDIPEDVTAGEAWIKCMNSPIWVRENIGNGHLPPGFPFQDPEGFTHWLNDTLGSPQSVDFVALIGLTIDRCVLCAAQELRWRGYEVRIVYEGTDAADGDETYKKQILTRSPLLNWASVIAWDELKREAG